MTLTQLLLFSIPAVLTTLVEPLSGVIDTAFVGHRESQWLADLGLSESLFLSLSWIFNFLAHRSTQELAFSSGEKNSSRVQEAINHTLTMGLFFGLAGGLVLLVFHESILDFMGGEGLTQARSYLWVRAFGFPLTILMTCLIGILRGFQELKKILLVLLAMTLTNALANYYFLFILQTSLAGVAWGTVFSLFLGTVLSFSILIKRLRREGILFSVKISWDRKILSWGKKSFWIFLRTASLTSIFFLSTVTASSLGKMELATHQILLQFWLLGAYVLDGFAATATIKGAYFLGQEAPHKFLLVKRKLLQLGTLIGLAFMAVYYFFKKPLFLLFTNDESLLLIFDQVWLIIAFSQLPNSLAFIYDGLLYGASLYKEMRNMMLTALILVFLPFLFLSRTFEEFSLLWYGLGAVNLFRLFYCERVIRRHFG